MKPFIYNEVASRVVFGEDAIAVLNARRSNWGCRVCW